MRELIPGKVPEELFWSLIELSSLRSEKVILALRDFLTIGYTRYEVCNKYKVSYGHFSLSFKRIRHINNILCNLAKYY